ncbi:hypothetical protein H8E88_09620 [candidate division KSB1 bacterium]|nr:hypothetical protein [candidate division KSB1 bacterium]
MKVCPEWGDSQGIQFIAELKIKTDNSYDSILLDDVPVHTNSFAEFTLNEETITIINDSDFNVDGTYEFVVSENKLALVVVTETIVIKFLKKQLFFPSNNFSLPL